MSVAWPQKTVKGLDPPGSRESADPYTESGQRQARVWNVAAVGSCKTPMRGPWSHRRLLSKGHRERPYRGLPKSGRPLYVFPDSGQGAWKRKTAEGLGTRRPRARETLARSRAESGQGLRPSVQGSLGPLPASVEGATNLLPGVCAFACIGVLIYPDSGTGTGAALLGRLGCA